MENCGFPYAHRFVRAAAALLLLAGAVAGCAGKARQISGPVSIPARPAAQEASSNEEADGVHHIVRPGQTLWRIARAYGVTMEEIAQANGIEDPTLITSGQPLFIPGATEVLDVAPYPAPISGTAIRSAGVVWLWPEITL